MTELHDIAAVLLSWLCANRFEIANAWAIAREVL
jgi:hypothetical protein